MHTEVLSFRQTLHRKELLRLYEYIDSIGIRGNRSFSYITKRGGSSWISNPPSIAEIRADLTSHPEEIYHCSMEVNLGLLGIGETTLIDCRNKNQGSVVKMVCSKKRTGEIKNLLFELIGEEGSCTYSHEYDKKYDSRLEVMFGGHIPAGHWPGKVQSIDALTERLTGTRMLQEHIPDFSKNWPDMSIEDGNYIGFIERDGELKVRGGAAHHGQSKTLGIGSYGVSIEFVYRGTEEALERAFRTSIRSIGFPRIVEASAGPKLAFFEDKGFTNKFLSNTTNTKGWNAAVRAVIAEGAELKIHNYSICRFPFNLLFREKEGKISKEGKVLDESWKIDTITNALNHGQIGSVLHLDKNANPEEIVKKLSDENKE